MNEMNERNEMNEMNEMKLKWTITDCNECMIGFECNEMNK